MEDILVIFGMGLLTMIFAFITVTYSIKAIKDIVSIIKETRDENNQC